MTFKCVPGALRVARNTFMDGASQAVPSREPEGT